MRRGIKITVWIVMSLVLLVAGILIGTVRVLTPDRLTPLTVDLANKSLNADVSIQRVELSLRRSFPFLNVDIDSMVMLSRDIRSLPVAVRDTLPEWADTLLAVHSMHGGINLFKLTLGVIDLKDLQIVNPQCNILVVNDSLDNFSITYPSAESDTVPMNVPDIRLNHFSLVDPRPIRYSDIAQDTHFTANIMSAELTNHPDGSSPYPPLYRIDFDCNVSSPILDLIGQRTLPIVFDGIVEWRHDEPYRLGLNEFHFAVSQLSGLFDVMLDFDDGLTVESCDFALDPISVTDFLAMVPDSLAKEYYIPKAARTDACINFRGTLTKPYQVGTTDLPFAEMSLTVPSCSLRYERVDLRHFELNTRVSMHGGSPDDAVISVDRFHIEGPATSLTLRGTLTDVVSDPLFDGEIDGNTDLGRLPSALSNHLHGSLNGRVTANTSVIARPSMLSRAHFHELRLAGTVSVDDFKYISDDTLSMYAFRRTDLQFGTHERWQGGRGVESDSLLSAKLSVDTANILVSGLDIKASQLRLGVGAQNRDQWTDTTLVIPMGGGLSARSMSLFSISDTAGLRLDRVRGAVSMKRYNDDAHLPSFNVNLGFGNLSTGNNRTRFMVDDGRLHCTLSELPDTALSVPRRQIRHLADSLHRCHPQLSIDSVYVMALEIRNRNRRPGHHRVHTELSNTDSEIIEWGTSSAMRRFLLDWAVDGDISAKTARLFTASFPVRNLVENFNIKFDNDSISLVDIMYKAGKSDFLISGNVTNIKRALTSRRTDNALKINFDVKSDFIDVNELSHALFTGSANRGHEIGDQNADEGTLEHNLESSERTDTVAAILIPTNIDARLHLQANSVAYADFLLNDVKGTILMYDGAVNLHDLTAASDVGSIDLTALYSAPSAQRIDFGFGMKLDNFNLHNFLKLVPAADSIMPMMRDFAGIINANVALTSQIDRNMDVMLPTMRAAINISGDSLTVMDQETFKKVSRWLLFKNKERNVINHVSAEMIVENGEMRIFPFIFDFDRYRLGIQGYNDFDMNLHYHVAVLRSPIPFKFGINISGSYDKLKIRLGGAKFNEDTPLARTAIVNDTRINLINQFQNVFRRGVRNSKFATLEISDRPLAVNIDLDTDTLSAADSTYFRENGLIP